MSFPRQLIQSSNNWQMQGQSEACLRGTIKCNFRHFSLTDHLTVPSFPLHFFVSPVPWFLWFERGTWPSHLHQHIEFTTKDHCSQGCMNFNLPPLSAARNRNNAGFQHVISTYYIVNHHYNMQGGYSIPTLIICTYVNLEVEVVWLESSHFSDFWVEHVKTNEVK